MYPANSPGWSRKRITVIGSRRDFSPYLETVFDAFGPERLMFGSDWPVCLLAAGYEQVFRLVDDFTRPLSAPAREAVFGGNAAKFYGISG